MPPDPSAHMGRSLEKAAEKLEHLQRSCTVSPGNPSIHRFLSGYTSDFLGLPDTPVLLSPLAFSSDWRAWLEFYLFYVAT